MAVEDIAEVEWRGLLVTRSSKSSGSLEELLVSCPCGSWDGLNMMVSIATASWTSLSSTASLPVREKKQRHLGSLWPEQCDSTQSLFLEPSSSLGRTWEEEGIWKPDVNTMWRGWVRCDRMEMRLFSHLLGCVLIGMCVGRRLLFLLVYLWQWHTICCYWTGFPELWRRTTTHELGSRNRPLLQVVLHRDIAECYHWELQSSEPWNC